MNQRTGTPAAGSSHAANPTRPGWRGRLPHRRQLPILVWMVVFWCGLWGSVSPLVVVGGVLVALALVAVFPMPTLPPAPRPSLVGSVRLALFVVYDLLRSSLQVAWFAVRPGPVPASAIVAAPLRSRSDAMIAATAELLSLVPGTLVVDIDVPSGTLYLHALVTGDPERVGDDVREQVRRMEERVLAALAPGALRDGTDVADDVREAQR
ncbi:Na+/H+ antiporter subunit E [Quadrisphaera setariae]|uniref:Na+/H+ antiporter subunit E n=1 Tax=Quadrisphaera setariae TaxID=2593304 RepID=A0A5C8ZDQ3_9ACTN|nr:Na+/H+ antiporter subunit E [Quadrisphaera setariae]TXR55947.1 Na+/H+ antiporter subunit E [Quadrisphaera setariae]